jgi:hypothetical protein
MRRRSIDATTRPANRAKSKNGIARTTYVTTP